MAITTKYICGLYDAACYEDPFPDSLRNFAKCWGIDISRFMWIPAGSATKLSEKTVTMAVSLHSMVPEAKSVLRRLKARQCRTAEPWKGTA